MIIKWVRTFAVAQAKVTHILRPGKASEKTRKGIILPIMYEISQNASRKVKKGINLKLQKRRCSNILRHGSV
jgi:hypothetical protein